ncbi:hypothetical protein JCM5353_004232, partial [Sporobolomyces roseus]
MAETPSHFSSWLGLAPHVRPLQVIASLSTATFSISFLVFISAATPFVLSSLLHVPQRKLGDITGSLILADELTALALYLPIGVLSDRIGVKWVAGTGYGVVAVALVVYVQAERVWQLVLARILFACGAGSLVATLSAVLSSLTEIPSLASSPEVQPDSSRFDAADESAISERSHLLSRRGSREIPQKSGRLAGLMGFSSGVGALIAVFGYLRLPTLFSRFVASSDDDFDSPAALARGLVLSFYFVAALSFLEAIFVFCALPGKSSVPRETGVQGRGWRKAMSRLAKRLGMGFVVAKGNGDVSLGLVTSFATRAQAVIVTAILPLLVNRYFLNNDLCSSLPELLSPEAPTKHSCRQAYILASILTGIVQLITLIFSPLVGLISASPILSRNSRNPQTVVLSISFLLGTLACIGFALLPDGDPRLKIVWVFSVGLGVAQAAGTVVSLALITKGRGDIVAKEGKEVSGALSSAYSFCGGLGILLIGSTAGILFDRWSSAPFLLLAGV